MARTNTRAPKRHTHEGAVASDINNEQKLRRTLMACMLWEKSFYEDGQDVAARLDDTFRHVRPHLVAAMAVEARTKMKLRHAPLLLVDLMAGEPEHKKYVADTLAQVIQRPDELSEFLALYWRAGKTPLSAQVKKGLARAFTKFNEYQLAKYNRDGAIKLRDVLFLCHAKPKDGTQAYLWKRLIDGKLETPDTWEVALSAGADKKATWERLMAERKLGALALLRNLRNMLIADVDSGKIRDAVASMNVERILPFRFVAAARFAPYLEPELEQAMMKSIEGREKLPGKTVLLIDVSGSMGDPISGKSVMTRMDAACGLAILAREMCEEIEIWTFSNNLVQVPPRRGFALRDVIVQSQPHGGTYLRGALENLPNHGDRIIVFTDEQSHDGCSRPRPSTRGYIANVASYQNGVGYGEWMHVHGFSEAILDYIQAMEKEGLSHVR